MANTFAPHGFKPTLRQDGAMWTGQVSRYTIATAYATSIFQYDLVTLVADGTIQKAATGTTGAGIVLGVFMGCQYVDSTGKVFKSPYWPASTALLGSNVQQVEAYVADDPNLLVEAQFSNAGAAETTAHTTAQIDVGAMYDLSILLASAGGSTATGLTNASVDYNSGGVQTIQKLRLVRYLDRQDNDLTLVNARGLFSFANHTYRLNVGV